MLRNHSLASARAMLAQMHTIYIRLYIVLTRGALCIFAPTFRIGAANARVGAHVIIALVCCMLLV